MTHLPLQGTVALLGQRSFMVHMEPSSCPSQLKKSAGKHCSVTWNPGNCFIMHFPETARPSTSASLPQSSPRFLPTQTPMAGAITTQVSYTSCSLEFALLEHVPKHGALVPGGHVSNSLQVLPMAFPAHANMSVGKHLPTMMPSPSFILLHLPGTFLLLLSALFPQSSPSGLPAHTSDDDGKSASRVAPPVLATLSSRGCCVVSNLPANCMLSTRSPPIETSLLCARVELSAAPVKSWTCQSSA
mmetsp:Transcript_70153/g.195183  ORF Transcript_70153/g.195183 Transcript_70153/m.195183 type:complete len:244 (-) Transcript_70153:981-1712(-)